MVRSLVPGQVLEKRGGGYMCIIGCIQVQVSMQLLFMLLRATDPRWCTTESSLRLTKVSKRFRHLNGAINLIDQNVILVHLIVQLVL